MAPTSKPRGQYHDAMVRSRFTMATSGIQTSMHRSLAQMEESRRRWHPDRGQSSVINLPLVLFWFRGGHRVSGKLLSQFASCQC
jgi:hypothetical protein